MRFLTAGLALPFGDDIGILNVAITTPWNEIIGKWLTPLSPAWYIPSTGADLTTRIIQTVILKLVFTVSGYNADAYHWLKDFCYAGVGLGVYCLVLSMTRNIFASVCSSILFYSCPFVYQSVAWTADFEIVNQIFVVISVIGFFRLYLGKKSWIWFAVTILSAWLAFRTRESSKVIPFVMLTFLAWEKVFPAKLQDARNWLFAAVTAVILAFLIIPQNIGSFALSVSNNDGTVRVWDLFMSNHHVQKLFSNPVFGAVFLLGGLAVFAGLLWFFIRQASQPYLRFVCVWFGAIFCSVLIFQTYFKFRYLTSLWVPASILFGALMNDWIHSEIKWFRVLGQISCIAGFLFVSGAGFFYTIHLRNHMSLKDSAAFNIAQLVYRDQFEAAAYGQKEMMYYFLGIPPSKPGEFDGIRVNEWDVIHNEGLTPADHETEIKKRLQTKFDQWGVAYLAAAQERGFETKSGGKLVGTVPSENNSLYTNVLKGLGYKFPVYYVFVWKERPKQ